MRVAILTVSDRCSRGEAEDLSGPALSAAVVGLGGRVVERRIVPDEREAIEEALRRWADGHTADVVLTTGGTGIARRDVTPEATLAVIDRRVPGIGEAMRAAGLKTTPNAILSRAEAGVRSQALIINLPGSPRGALECLQAVAPVLRHAIDLLAGRTAHGP